MCFKTCELAACETLARVSPFWSSRPNLSSRAAAARRRRTLAAAEHACALSGARLPAGVTNI